MKLLNQEQTKSDKDRSEAERKLRVKKLNDEETAITKRVNEARENEIQEKARIDADLASFQREKDAEKVAIEATLEPLRNEVKELEERKAEAMKPVDEARKEADRIHAEATAKEAINAEKEVELAEGQRNLIDRAERLVEREERALEREQDLDKREERLKAEEESSKTSAHSLSVKWAEYHEKVDATNADLARRERDVENGRKTNEVYAESLRTEAGELAKGRLQLKDQYRALEQAKIHLGIK